jgi:tetratricopeptide (TPR) repeat protein
MDMETLLNQAMNWMAEGRQGEAEILVQSGIDEVQKAIDGTPDDALRHYQIGRMLSVLEEPEQALLRYERALNLLPDHAESLFEMARTLFRDLEKPEMAKTLIEGRLLTSGNKPEYRELLGEVDATLRMMGRQGREEAAALEAEATRLSGTLEENASPPEGPAEG